MTSFRLELLSITFFFSRILFNLYFIHNKRITFTIVGDRYRDYLIFITSALIICN